MKVLFICSGNSKYFEMAPFIKSQGDSLQEIGVSLSYFRVLGRGWWNYLKNAIKLRRYLKTHSFDLIHAHYSYCGWVAVLAAGKTPVVMSLMGDDAVGTPIDHRKITLKSRLLTFLAWSQQPFVKAIISKSDNLEKVVYRKRISHIIPNGIRLDQFKLVPEGCRNELGLRPDKQYVLFLGNPSDRNKNIDLVKAALDILGRPDVELLNPFPISHDEVMKHLNSADVFVLCSYAEGSPNVVKEAMACNCPIVATAVGDVAWVIGNTPGCHIASFDPADFAEKLDKALAFAQHEGRTQGRQRILDLGLDGKSIAQKLSAIYEKVLGQASLASQKKTGND
jgi:teichuronic acid biosynthesis glycosyltransferase TuaC